jgi:hypothetical protein
MEREEGVATSVICAEWELIFLPSLPQPSSPSLSCSSEGRGGKDGSEGEGRREGEKEGGRVSRREWRRGRERRKGREGGERGGEKEMEMEESRVSV